MNITSTFNPAGFPAGTIQVQYQPPAVGAGAAPPLEQVITYSIPSDVNFAVQAGFPANTPDGFGAGVNAIDFGQALAGEPLNYVVFMPDGSSQDNLGNYNSGIVYLHAPGRHHIYNTSRAITVWGATGRIRGWRLGQQAGRRYLGTTMTQENKSVRKHQAQRGFTLIEVMIAIVIMTIGLLAVMASFATAITATASAQEDLIARHKALDAMESIYTARNSQQLPFTSINNTTPTAESSSRSPATTLRRPRWHRRHGR